MDTLRSSVNLYLSFRCKIFTHDHFDPDFVMKLANPKARGQSRCPTVHECWKMRNETQITIEWPGIFSLQLRDEIIQLWGWDWTPLLEHIGRRFGLRKWALTEEQNFLLWEERNVVMWLLCKMFSSTRQILSGLKLFREWKMRHYLRVSMKVYLTESTVVANILTTQTSGILLQFLSIPFCHYTPTHAPNHGLILALGHMGTVLISTLMPYSYKNRSYFTKTLRN